MANTDQAEGAIDKAVGKAKEIAGKLTGDHETEAEGHADQAKGDAKKLKGDLKDKI